MAQVTMSGLEYIELMHKAEQLEGITNWFCKATKVRFPEGSIRSYSAGEFPEYEGLPKWMEEARINYMAGWLCDLPEEEFIRWVESETRYLNVKDLSLTKYSFDGPTLDLWEHPKLQKVVAMVQENLAKEKEVKEDA